MPASCVQPTYSVTFATVAVVFVLKVATASWLPASPGLDPTKALREE